MKRYRTVLLILVLVFGAAPLRAQHSREDLDEMVDDIARQVETLRGLKFKKKVKLGLKSRRELRDYLLKAFEEELPIEKAKEIEMGYKKLGLLPPNCDLRKTILDLLTSQIGGFYDPRTKELYVIRPGEGKGKSNPMMRRMEMVLRMAGTSIIEIVAAHELTHALQDQHYDLMALQEPIQRNDDRVNALKCLLEGDAVRTQNQFLMSKMPPEMRRMMKAFAGRRPGGKGLSGLNMPGSGMEGVPEFLKVSLAYPYIVGPRFLAHLEKTGRMDLLDALFRNPPRSTEQMMHFETKLIGQVDEPQRIVYSRLTELVADGHRLLENNVLGEMGTFILLKTFLGEKAARDAAAGWDGDTYQIFNREGRPAFLWVTTWDSEDEAREFAAAYQKLLDRKYKVKGAFDVEPDGDSGLLFVGCGDLESYNLLVRRGADVAVVEGFSVQRARRIGRQVWRHFLKRPYRHHTAMPLPHTSPKPKVRAIRAGAFQVVPPGKPWKRTEPTGDLVRFSFHNMRIDATIEGARLDIGRPMTARSVAELMGESARKRLTRLQILAFCATEGAAMTGWAITYTRAPSNTAMVYRHVVFCRGTAAYVFTVSAPRNRFERAAMALERLLSKATIGE